MSTDRDTTRIVRSWLMTDEHESADRVLDAVLDRLDTTPQRRATWWSVWRYADMNPYAMLAIAATVVVVIGVVGFNLLPAHGIIGGPLVSPSPSAPPAATSTPITPDLSTEIDPGSYVISTPQVRVRLIVPAGWSGGETNIWRLPAGGFRGMLELAVTPYEVSLAVADVCTDEADVDFVEVGPTVEDLTSALESQTGVQRWGPTDITLGGFPTKKLVLTLLPDCPGSQGHGFWADATRTWGLGLKHGETGIVYVVDVNGERLVITSQYGADASAEDIAQLEAITASIVIEPVPDPAPRTDVSPGGWLAIGRHALTVDGVPLSFSTPALEQDLGWARDGSLSISKDTFGSQGAEAMIYWTGFPDGEDTDPCAHLLSLPAGASAADVAAAVSAMPGTEVVTEPSDATVGGRAASYVALTVEDDLGCDPGFFFTYEPPPGGPGWWTTDVGDTIRVWVVDIDGMLLFIAGETKPEASPELERELEQIVDSIEFE
jgi:hypothetical protein